MGLTSFVIIYVFIASFSPAQGERNQMVNAKVTRPVNEMPMSNCDILSALNCIPGFRTILILVPQHEVWLQKAVIQSDGVEGPPRPVHKGSDPKADLVPRPLPGIVVGNHTK